MLTFTYRMLKVLVSRAQNICIAEDHWKKKLEHLEKIFQVCDNYAQQVIKQMMAKVSNKQAKAAITLIITTLTITQSEL